MHAAALPSAPVTAASETTALRLAAAWDGPAGRAACAGIDALVAGLPDAAVLHRDRNTLWRCEVLGRPVVVKRFRLRRSLRMRIDLACRGSKALRSFDIAQRLLGLGMATPEPLAAVEVHEDGAVARAYYVCAWQEHAGTARALRDEGFPEAERHVRELGGWAGRLHEAGALQRDLNGGNVLLVGAPAGSFVHALVDLNRVRFGRVALRRGLANLVLLGFPGDRARPLVEGYCAARGADADAAWRAFRLERALQRAWWRCKSATRPLRRRLGG